MFIIAPVGSLFDFLTFLVRLRMFSASEQLFHTGWFVESLATQKLVLFVDRTGGNPFRSRPSRALALTFGGVAISGIILPCTPLTEMLGFVPLFVGGAYLGLVEVVNRILLRQVLR
jgi:P-type Mg2+ transporter